MRVPLLSITSIILALFLTCVSLAPFVDTWLDRFSSLQAAETRLSELRAKRLDPPQAQYFREVMAAAPDPESGLLADGDGTELASRLRDIIDATSRSHGADLAECVLEGRTIEGGESLVRARLKIAVGNNDVGSLIRSLESGKPAFFFEQLHIFEEPPGVSNERPMLSLAATVVVYREIRPRGKSGI